MRMLVLLHSWHLASPCFLAHSCRRTCLPHTTLLQQWRCTRRAKWVPEGVHLSTRAVPGIVRSLIMRTGWSSACQSTPCRSLATAKVRVCSGQITSSQSRRRSQWQRLPQFWRQPWQESHWDSGGGRQPWEAKSDRRQAVWRQESQQARVAGEGFECGAWHLMAGEGFECGAWGLLALYNLFCIFESPWSYSGCIGNHLGSTHRSCTQATTVIVALSVADCQWYKKVCGHLQI